MPWQCLWWNRSSLLYPSLRLKIWSRASDVGVRPPLRHHYFNDLRRLASSPPIAFLADSTGTALELACSVEPGATRHAFSEIRLRDDGVPAVDVLGPLSP